MAGSSTKKKKPNTGGNFGIALKTVGNRKFVEHKITKSPMKKLVLTGRSADFRRFD